MLSKFLIVAICLGALVDSEVHAGDEGGFLGRALQLQNWGPIPPYSGQKSRLPVVASVMQLPIVRGTGRGIGSGAVSGIGSGKLLENVGSGSAVNGLLAAASTVGTGQNIRTVQSIVGAPAVMGQSAPLISFAHRPLVVRPFVPPAPVAIQAKELENAAKDVSNRLGQRLGSLRLHEGASSTVGNRPYYYRSSEQVEEVSEVVTSDDPTEEPTMARGVVPGVVPRVVPFMDFEPLISMPAYRYLAETGGIGNLPDGFNGLKRAPRTTESDSGSETPPVVPQAVDYVYERIPFIFPDMMY